VAEERAAEVEAPVDLVVGLALDLLRDELAEEDVLGEVF